MGRRRGAALETAALVLVLSSAFLHAAWNALLKRHPNPEVGVVSVMSVVILASGIWALGMRGPAFSSSEGLVWALWAGVCESVYLAGLARSLRQAPLGLAYTVSRGGAMLLVWPVSVLWLGEAVSSWTVSGVAMLCVGLAVMNLSRPSGAAGAGVAWAALSAVGIAGYHLSYKMALGTGAQPPALFATGLLVALPVLILERGRQQGWAAFRREALLAPGLVLTAGLISALSFGLLLTALAGGGAGVVLTLRNTSIAFALVLAALQGERLGRRQLSGAALVAVGALLLGVPA
ncbi:putative membrane protein [Myxococcus xanthus DK 1622]|uniref:Membrane protein n=1 Tax=Myxococcus xanthus (strain DK1622) TaxID=246197 RepID=Q1DCP3_MYXXD|nr:EamA family transporter [Myxococcus xanthus]ABF92158.1 putative membrane protein [Myxococcus xanthus DK 1622]NOJ58111.1 EamA family transporter [Myxococcus xanthus]QPM80965.1 EamA family transporter [Myxococcus xanthus]QVW70024.1 EamA family transporter [Myxococcus xanthus DZ2]UEO03846.1 EamA family transporter [Myxococcus xanthus DZ2]